MDYKEIPLTQTMKYNGRILNLREDTVRLPDNSTAFREVVEHNGGSCVLALTPDKKVLLVKQYRYGAGETLWELPAGKLEMGEDPLVCATRELTEETGYQSDSLSLLGTLYPTPAYDEEIIYIYFTDTITPDKQHLDEGEFLEVAQIPFEQAVEWVMNGTITDAKTQIAILKAKERLV